MLHLKGRSPVCTRWCLFRSQSLENRFLQTWHSWSNFPPFFFSNWRPLIPEDGLPMGDNKSLPDVWLWLNIKPIRNEMIKRKLKHQIPNRFFVWAALFWWLKWSFLLYQFRQIVLRLSYNRCWSLFFQIFVITNNSSFRSTFTQAIGSWQLDRISVGDGPMSSRIVIFDGTSNFWIGGRRTCWNNDLKGSNILNIFIEHSRRSLMVSYLFYFVSTTTNNSDCLFGSLNTTGYLWWWIWSVNWITTTFKLQICWRN